MTVSLITEGKGCMAIDIVGVASVAAAGQGQILNPEGVDLLILRSTLYIITPATAAALMSIGFAATGVLSVDLIDALSMVQTAKTIWNGHAPQFTAKSETTAPLWEAEQYLTFSTVNQSALPLHAILFLDYIRLE